MQTMNEARAREILAPVLRGDDLVPVQPQSRFLVVSASTNAALLDQELSLDELEALVFWLRRRMDLAATPAPSDKDEAEPAMLLRNHYECPRCGTHWEDVWSAACNDECPGCGLKDIEPFESEEVTNV